MNYVLGSRAAIGGVLGRGGAAAAADWWLSGGVSAANAIAVYQPIGAASLAASYTNLANPGTYDAAPGVAPTFAAATGWTFNGSTQYLATGIIPTNDQTWSAIGRFSDVSGTTYGDVIGVFLQTPSRGFILRPRHNATVRGYANGGEYFTAGTSTTGTMAIAGNAVYFDGVAEPGTIPASSGVLAALYIGRTNYFAPRWLSGKIQALAIYNATLSAAQVAAISAAMAAL